MRQLIQTTSAEDKVETLRGIINANDTGKVFTIVNVKKDGGLRTYRAMLNVKADLKGGESTTAHKRELITVFEPDSNGYRAINLETVLSIKIGQVDALFIDTDTASRITDSSVRLPLLSAATMTSSAFAVLAKLLSV